MSTITDIRREQDVYRDVRSRRRRILDWSRTSSAPIAIAAASLVAVTTMPFLGETPWLALPMAGATAAALLAGANRLRRRRQLREDAEARKTGLLFGRDRLTGRPVSLPDGVMARGVLTFGTTGSGKTEHLVSLSREVLGKGGGFLYVDRQADPSIAARLAAHAAAVGRDDVDVAVLGRRAWGSTDRGSACRDPAWEPSVVDPFEGLSLDDQVAVAADVLTTRLDPVGDPPLPDPGEAVRRLLRILLGSWDPTRCGCSRVIRLSTPAGIEVVAAAGGTDASDYLASLPGYDPERGARQARETLDAHGAAASAISSVFGRIAALAPEAFSNPICDVSLPEVVDGRRALFVMLPLTQEVRGDDLALFREILFAPVRRHLARRERDGIAYAHPLPFLIAVDEVGACMFDEARRIRADHAWSGIWTAAAMQDSSTWTRRSLTSDAEVGAFHLMKVEKPFAAIDAVRSTDDGPGSGRVRGFSRNADRRPDGVLSVNEADVLHQCEGQGILVVGNAVNYLEGEPRGHAREGGARLPTGRLRLSSIGGGLA